MRVQSDTPRRSYSGLDHDLLESQIALNTSMIDQINELKQERERSAALYEKSAKEKQLLAMKYSKANEQLSYMMKNESILPKKIATRMKATMLQSQRPVVQTPINIHQNE